MPEEILRTWVIRLTLGVVSNCWRGCGAISREVVEGIFFIYLIYRLKGVDDALNDVLKIYEPESRAISTLKTSSQNKNFDLHWLIIVYRFRNEHLLFYVPGTGTHLQRHCFHHPPMAILHSPEHHRQTDYSQLDRQPLTRSHPLHIYARLRQHLTLHWKD